MYQLKANEIKEYRAMILERDQNGKCAICGKEPSRPCLDHHHTKRVGGTGQVRGVLCSNCNVFLAKSENNASRYGISKDDLPGILRAMADYIEKDQYALIHPSEAPKPKRLMKSSYNELKRAYSGKKKFPEYPRSGKLTKPLERLFEAYGIKPKFYKEK